MKQVIEQNRSHMLCAYYIRQIPYLREDKRTSISRQLFSDAFFLSNGDGSLSLELLRMAGTIHGKSICHVLVVRARNLSSGTCTEVMAAMRACVEVALRDHGFVFEELPFEVFARLYQAQDRTCVWAVVKDEIRESETLSPTVHLSVPVFAGEADFSALYTALDGSGCTVSVQMIPRAPSTEERNAVNQRFAACGHAADGSMLVARTPRDHIASYAQRRWNDAVQMQNGPMATVNILISGSRKAAAVLVARLRSCLADAHTEAPAQLRSLPMSDFSPHSALSLPWEYADRIAEMCLREGYGLAAEPNLRHVIQTVGSAEGAMLLSFPEGNGAFNGVSKNAFSLLRRDASLPEEMVAGGRGQIALGSVDGTVLSLPAEDLLLHTAIFGKTGCGKTSLLLHIISQLTENKIPVLILEPIKREYRTLIRKKHTRVYTVDSKISPFVLNPFLVPNGVTLSQYRPHLLNAFSAAFSMPDPLPSLFGTALTRAYALYGWKDSSTSQDPDTKVFGLWEFVQVFQDVIEHSSYSPEIKGNMLSGGTFRLLSLLDRSRSTYEAIRSVDVRELLSGEVVLELGRLEGEQKCLTAALVLISVLAYLRSVRSSEAGLKNVIVLDEAHVLLDTGDPVTEEAKAASATMETLVTNIVAEMRALGVGIILSDQSPHRIGENLLNNTDSRILFRLTGTEAAMAAEGLGLDENELLALTQLQRGQALVDNHRLESVTGMKTAPYETGEAVSDRELLEYTQRLRIARTEYKPFSACDSCLLCSAVCDHRVREAAAMAAIQMSAGMPRLRSGDDLKSVLLQVPKQALPKINGATKEQVAACAALQLFRRVRMEQRIGLREEEVKTILKAISKGGMLHERVE